jgi:hypothetical protein
MASVLSWLVRGMTVTMLFTALYWLARSDEETSALEAFLVLIGTLTGLLSVLRDYVQSDVDDIRLEDELAKTLRMDKRDIKFRMLADMAREVAFGRWLAANGEMYRSYSKASWGGKHWAASALRRRLRLRGYVVARFHGPDDRPRARVVIESSGGGVEPLQQVWQHGTDGQWQCEESGSAPREGFIESIFRSSK